jgi:hypothetical protein
MSLFTEFFIVENLAQPKISMLGAKLNSFNHFYKKCDDRIRWIFSLLIQNRKAEF